MLVVDHDDIGFKGITDVIENTSYPNRCISPTVLSTQIKRVEWRDDHPLNMIPTMIAEANRMFGE
jgi:hypothetical protein